MKQYEQWIGCLIVWSVCGALWAEPVQLDISSGFTLDCWCGPEEMQELYEYDAINGENESLKDVQGDLKEVPIGWYTYTQGGMMVGNSATEQYFIPSMTWYGDTGNSWMSEAEGTPADGTITGSDRVYHIASHEGNATLPGDWLSAEGVSHPTNHPPEALMAYKLNAMAIGSLHNRADWQVAATTGLVTLVQQGRYTDINFVLGASYHADGARNAQIVALYNDASVEVLYSFPTSNEIIGPTIDDEREDLYTEDFVPVYHFTRAYNYSSGGQPGSITHNNQGTLFEFVTPLLLNPGKILVGIILRDSNPSLNWNARGLAIFAATATPIAKEGVIVR